MIWQELTNKIGYSFNDESYVTQVHETHTAFCYRFWLKKRPFRVKDNSITISDDHYLLCELNVSEEWIDYIKELQPTEIPILEDYHMSIVGGKIEGEEKIVEKESWCYDKEKNQYWLSGLVIFTLLMNLGRKSVKPVGNQFVRWDAVGNKECFCVSTNTGKYECCGVISHNSVALRNIIFHSLTHGEDIVLGLVDLKQSEFVRYKGVNNIVAVAHTKLEAAELLRMAREVMHKRNAENAARGLTDFADYKPQKPLPIIKIFGREFPEDYEFNVMIGDEEKTMTAKEILEYMGGE